MKNYSIRQAFNKAANTYDDHCHLQQQAGLHLLNKVKTYQPQAEYIIDLGCGTGLMTQLIAQNYQYSKFYAVDIAENLLAIAKERLTNIKVEENDFNNIVNYPLSFDLVFSNLALHWSTAFSDTLKKIHSRLHPKGNLAFSIPLNDTFCELSPHFNIRDFLSFKMAQQLLLQQGFHISYCHHTRMTYHFDNAISALRSIKYVGATYVDHNKRPHLTKSLLQSIEPLRTLTYVIGYFIASKS